MSDMQLPGLTTLSGRIRLGFAVLILTFATVTAVTVGNLVVLGPQIRVIPNGYLQLALLSKDAAEKQKRLRDYLRDELGDEQSERTVRHRVRRLRNQRDRLLSEASTSMARIADVPESHRVHVRRTQTYVDDLRKQIAATTRDYDTLLARPPVAREESVMGVISVERQMASKALARLIETESALFGDTWKFAQHQELLVRGTANNLAENGRRVRTYTVILGVLAISVGLFITLWVTYSLRPLRRLPSAARRIARGEYSSRIDENGPREVADLAHEFNRMGLAIEERERELVRSERLAAVGKMAAMITHEVRNPLSSIGLNTELLEEELSEVVPESAEARELCRAINGEIDRLTEITEEYLRFARLPKPKPEPSDVGELVHSVARFVRESLSARGIQLDVDIADGLKQVPVDEAQLKQVLHNLIRNASEALQGVDSPCVTIMVRRDGDACEIVVSDNGPGIPKELADKLFDPFVSTKERGSGLGLAMTHQIVLEHGGRVTVDSAPGAGSAFHVRLPATSTAG